MSLRSETEFPNISNQIQILLKNCKKLLVKKSNHDEQRLRIASKELDEAVSLLRRFKESDTGQLFNDLLITQCRVLGCLHNYKGTIAVADNILADNSYHFVTAHILAMSYKGLALYQMKRHNEAILILEESHKLLNQNQIPQTKHILHVKMIVESTLVSCCQVLGRQPPLPPLIKYPRTSHLFQPENSKAVTEDDLILPNDHSMVELICDGETEIFVEEKCDGANLGISLSYDGKTLLVQNRSHYISEGEHAQFSPLKTFLEIYKESLREILGDKRETILFGEWLVARHSIPYAQLPSYFVAFDLYHIASKKFASRKVLHAKLEGSGIPVVPVLAKRSFGPYKNRNKFESSLLRLLETTPSKFRSDHGPIEGIVFRIDNDEWLIDRCKLVRPDFVAGCEQHWTRLAIEKQQVDHAFASTYMKSCYCEALNETGLPVSVANPRERIVVMLGDQNSAGRPTLKITNGSIKRLLQHSNGILLPRNLCWLWRNEIAISSTPKSSEQIQALNATFNVGLVVTLTKEEALPNEWFSASCQNFFYPIPDGHSPTLKDMDDIGNEMIRALIRNAQSSILIHCGGGKGRAGTIAACLLLRFGKHGIWHRINQENSSNDGCDVGHRSLYDRHPFMTAEEAIKTIRDRRPGSIETLIQEQFVHEYAQHLWRGAARLEAVFKSQKKNDEGKIQQQQALFHAKRPKFVLLMGLPGSGKSSLGRRLAASSSKIQSWTHINQDILGKNEFEDQISRAASNDDGGGGVVIDCCCVRIRDRHRIWKLLQQPERANMAIVFMDTPFEVCCERVKARIDHPTIPFQRGERIVRNFASRLEHPAINNEQQTLFNQIRIIQTISDVDSLVREWLG